MAEVAGAGGIAAWKEAGMELDTIESISAENLAEKSKPSGATTVIDVRKPSEFAAGHIKDAESVPLDFINEHMGGLDRQQQYFVHCAGGYRSMIAASILKARGFENVVDVKGGFKAILDSGKFETTDFVCPNAKTLQQEKAVSA